MSGAISRGAKFVSGTTESGRLVLARDDGESDRQALLLVDGVLVDNGDGTWDIEY